MAKFTPEEIRLIDKALLLVETACAETEKYLTENEADPITVLKTKLAHVRKELGSE